MVFECAAEKFIFSVSCLNLYRFIENVKGYSRKHYLPFKYIVLKVLVGHGRSWPLAVLIFAFV